MIKIMHRMALKVKYNKYNETEKIVIKGKNKEN